MGEIFAYSLCSSILLLLLYTVYKWVLSGEKQHTYNRIILWLIYAVALLAAPAIGRWHQLLSASDLAAVAIGDAGFTPDVIASADKASQALWLTVVLWVYVVGCVVIMLHTLWIGWRLRSLISSAREVARVGSKIVLVTDDSGVAPFSWYRYIVMNRSDWAESSQMILLHESQHIALCHSLDLLVGQLVAIFQWYNPAAWLMREEMKAVHEYQADEAVIASGVSVRDYQMLLIKKAVGARFPSLANSLNHSKLKKRITMMYNPKKSAVSRLRGLALVPALGVALAVTNIDAVASVLSEAASASIGFATDKVTEIPQTLQEPVQESSATEYAGVSARTSNDSLPAQAGEGRPTKVLKVKLSDDGTASASDISSEATVIYVDGKSVSRQQLDALNPSQIKSMDVNKEGERTKIYVVSKSDDEKSADTSNPSSVKAKSLTIKKSDDGTTSTAKANWDATEVFIDGQSATREQLNALNPSQIKAMDVKKEEGVTKIYITLKSDSDK